MAAGGPWRARTASRRLIGARSWPPWASPRRASGDSTRARSTSGARALAGRRRDRALAARCDYLLAANVHYVRGDLVEALATARRARDLARACDLGELTCHAEGVVGFVLAALGREADAREPLLRAHRRAEAIGYRLIAGYSRYTLGECDLLAGDAAAAHESFADAARTARELGEEALLNLACLGTSEAARRLGDVDEAIASASEALALAERRGDRFFRGRALGLLARARGDRDQVAAAGGFDRAERVLARIGATMELARIRLWRAELSGPEQLERERRVIAAGPHAGLLRQLGLASGASRGGPDPSRSVTAAASGLVVRVLGTVEVDRHGEPLVRGTWRSRRARGLFNVLAAARFTPVPREQVREALWPDADPARSATSLRQAVFQLRRILDAGAVGGASVLRTDGETITLVLDGPDACDRLVFERRIGEARDARRRRDHGRELDRLLGAVELWRGPFLADTPYERTVEDAAVALRQTYLPAIERAARLLSDAGRWDEALDVALRGLQEDPLHEPFAVHQLQALLALDRRGEVRRAYDRFATRFREELDLLPSDTLMALAEGRERDTAP
ncbi:hypothetical protein GF314_13330 [bacterium]|nr:hypothetical protein [bacterium]